MKQHLLFCPLALLLCSQPVLAQITPDGNLGTKVIPDVKIKGTIGDRIDGGRIVGNNLFHSFSEFNINTGRGVYFTNSTDITNIFTRVTGNTASNINGTIGVIGNANLFFLNPQGIVFGPSAKLDIKGSFLATTANAIGLANGDIFSADSTTALPTQILNVNPNALLFNQIPVQPIVNRSTTGLKVPDGQSLLLAGGNISLEGGNLHALGGRVELVAVSGQGKLGLSVDGKNLYLSVPAELPRADITLNNQALVDVAAPRGGSIAIAAQNFRVLGSSDVEAGVTGIGSLNGGSGNIDIDVADTISMDDNSVITTRINSRSVGNAGNINITTGSFFATNGSQLSASTRGQGNAGDINISAKNTVSFDGVRSRLGSGMLSVVRSSGVGNGGNLNITAGSFSVTNGGRIITATEGQGNAGNVNINVREAVTFNGFGVGVGPSSAVSEVRLGGGAQVPGRGNAGNINITAKAIGVSGGAQLSGRTSGQGNGGDIILNTNTLDIDNLGQVFTTSFTSGDAGNIIVNARDKVTLTGNNPALLEKILQSGFSFIRAAGSASGLYANSDRTSTGRGGSLHINTKKLTVTDGAQVNVSNLGTGNAGDLDIKADSIHLDKKGSLRAETNAGNQGNININTDILFMRHGGDITTNATGTANGGNIDIKADTIVQLANSNITANAIRGQGGNINITTQGLFRSPDSDITASSKLGINGIVNISTPDINQESSLTHQPSNFVSSDQIVASSCIAKRNNQQGRFAIAGNGALPDTPDSDLEIPYQLMQVQAVNTGGNTAIEHQPTKTWKLGEPIVEAQGLVKTTDGRIVLAATPDAASLPPVTNFTCK